MTKPEAWLPLALIDLSAGTAPFRPRVAKLVELSKAESDAVETRRSLDPPPEQRRGLPEDLTWFCDLAPAPYALGANFAARRTGWVDRRGQLRMLEPPLSLVYVSAAADKRRMVVCDYTTAHVVDLATGASHQLALDLTSDDGGHTEKGWWSLLAVEWVGGDRIAVQTFKRMLLVDLDGRKLAERSMSARRAGLAVGRGGRIVVLAGQDAIDVCACEGASFALVERIPRYAEWVYAIDDGRCYAKLGGAWNEIAVS